jgi:hypothetical protein
MDPSAAVPPRNRAAAEGKGGAQGVGSLDWAIPWPWNEEVMHQASLGCTQFRGSNQVRVAPFTT